MLAQRTPPLDLSLEPVERLLFLGTDVAAVEFRCPQAHPHFGGAGPLRNWIIGFPRRASRLQREGSAPFVADPNTVVFLNPGDAYRRDALGDEPDHSDVFAISRSALADCLEQVAPRWNESGEPRFGSSWAPLQPTDYLAVRRVVERGGMHAGDIAGREEAALVVIGGVIARAASEPRRPAPSRARRTRRDLVEAARAVIASHVGEPLTLPQLAARVHSSPFHLARSFRALTGSSIHQYMLRQRVGRSLEMLRDGVPVCDVALRLGFAAHSHFTETFVRFFGTTPSAWVKRD